MLLETGTCSIPATSVEECRIAAQALNLSSSQVTLDGQSGVSFDPPYCYFEESTLKLNLGNNTGNCSSDDLCLCEVNSTEESSAGDDSVAPISDVSSDDVQRAFVAVRRQFCPCTEDSEGGCDLPECSPMTPLGQLCEADAALPDGNLEYEVDNCAGGFDVFVCLEALSCPDGSPDNCSVEELHVTGPFEPRRLATVKMGMPIRSSLDMHSCPEGWKVFSPRSPSDWQTATDSIGNISSKLPLVLDVRNALNGYLEPPVNSNVSTRSNWATSDGSPWWLRSSFDGVEAKGNYTSQCYIALTEVDSAGAFTIDVSSCLDFTTYFCQLAREIPASLQVRAAGAAWMNGIYEYRQSAELRHGRKFVVRPYHWVKEDDPDAILWMPNSQREWVLSFQGSEYYLHGGVGPFPSRLASSSRNNLRPEPEISIGTAAVPLTVTFAAEAESAILACGGSVVAACPEFYPRCSGDGNCSTG
jgi:hypothetical protein